MIRYALHCEAGHDFESWFANSAAFDKQAKRKLVECPVCGSSKIEKSIMAPRLARTDDAPRAEEIAEAPGMPNPVPPTPPAKTPVMTVSPQERVLRQKLKELREHITKNSNYVGARFPEEARKIHYGETEHRSIYGEASPDEAKELHEEGIEFHPIPILPDEHN